MQEAFINLKEVIWEITDTCHNGCDYCGSSKSNNKTPIKQKNIFKIAEELARLEPEEINFSGGDPLEIEPHEYRQIIDKFDVNTKFKIICNPLSIRNIDETIIEKILLQMDVIGLSVNTLEELKYANKIPRPHDIPPITIITNFNLLNIYDFEKIETFVLENDFGWQVQFTIDDNIGLYKNEIAVGKLFEKLWEHYDNNPKRNGMTFIADNMNSAPCLAGVRGMGVCANGDVVPCLSMRSYMDKMPVIGNLLEEPAELIWKQGFNDFRCSEFKCCKDACKGFSYFDLITKDAIIKKPNLTFPPNHEWDRGPVHNPNQIMMYAVQETKQWTGTIVYGVQQPQTFVYGVRGIDDNMSSKVFDKRGNKNDNT